MVSGFKFLFDGLDLADPLFCLNFYSVYVLLRYKRKQIELHLLYGLREVDIMHGPRQLPWTVKM